MITHVNALHVRDGLTDGRTIARALHRILHSHACVDGATENAGPDIDGQSRRGGH